MTQATVVTIGNFDGVHVGHRAIVARARAAAAAGRVVAVTFDPHPASLLRPASAPPMLQSLDDRAASLRAAGADEVVVVQTTPDLLATSAEDFLARLVERFTPSEIVEGSDFHFGKDRRGTPEFLAGRAAAMGFRLTVVPPVTVGLSDQLEVAVRSSLVRWLLSNGRAMDVARCLGRPFELAGVVVAGERRGRTIGFPTANLDPATLGGRALPGAGVYAGVAQAADGVARPAAISVGVKPTFGGQRAVIEAHLPGFAGDLYGQTLRLSFARWLRDQQPFPSLDDLKRQLAADVTLTRDWFHAGRLTHHALGAPWK